MIVLADGYKATLLSKKRPLLITLSCALFVNDVNLTHATTWDDLVEATFPGYTRLNVNAWGTAYLNADFQGQIDHPLLTWTMTGDLPTNTIFGYALIDSATRLVMSERRVSGGFPLEVPGAQFSLSLSVREDSLP